MSRCSYISQILGQCRREIHPATENHCYNGLHTHASYWEQDDSSFFVKMLEKGYASGAEPWSPPDTCKDCWRPFRRGLNWLWKRNTARQAFRGIYCVGCFIKRFGSYPC